MREDHHKSPRRVSLASLTLAPFGWHPRPFWAEDHHHHHHHHQSTSVYRAPGPTTMKTNDDQDGWTTGMDNYQNGRLRGWTTSKTDDDDDDDDDRDGRRRRLKTEDNGAKRQSTLAVALPKRQSTLAVDLLKRPGPSRYYCPSSDVGGPKRTVDKDGRLSEDGEADG
ncbi:hypothetical protein TYRP_007095 [Tyrophagus putrescentiae]|nr:hypothetical protein TYRP_007095 [Tyrophagus putrescentiae]